MPINVEIKQDKNWFIPGEKIIGKLLLSVSGSPISAEMLTLTFKGSEKFMIDGTEIGTASQKALWINIVDRLYQEKKELLNHIFKIAIFTPNKIQPGYYQYPFEITIPGNLPLSFYIEKNLCKEESHVKIRYSIVAQQHTADPLQNLPWSDYINSKFNQKIEIFLTGNITCNYQLAEGKYLKTNMSSINLNSCCKTKKVRIKINLFKGKFTNDESIKLTVGILNSSSRKINFEVHLVQFLKISWIHGANKNPMNYTLSDILYKSNLGDYQSTLDGFIEKRLDIKIPPFTESTTFSGYFKNFYKIIIVGKFIDNCYDIIKCQEDIEIFKFPISDSPKEETPKHYKDGQIIIAGSQAFEFTSQDHISKFIDYEALGRSRVKSSHPLPMVNLNQPSPNTTLVTASGPTYKLVLFHINRLNLLQTYLQLQNLLVLQMSQQQLLFRSKLLHHQNFLFLYLILLLIKYLKFLH